MKAIFGGKNDSHERLDALGREALRLACADDETLDAVASSPFLYTRVRARIDAGRETRAANPVRANLIRVASRALPAMALLAAVAFGVFWFGAATAPAPGAFPDDVFFAANESPAERVLFVERNLPSSDDAYDAIVGSDSEQSK